MDIRGQRDIPVRQVRQAPQVHRGQRGQHPIQAPQVRLDLQDTRVQPEPLVHVDPKACLVTQVLLEPREAQVKRVLPDTQDTRVTQDTQDPRAGEDPTDTPDILVPRARPVRPAPQVHRVWRAQHPIRVPQARLDSRDTQDPQDPQDPREIGG